MEKIISKQNENVKRIRGLVASKKDRDAAGLFVCEGLRLCLDGAKSGIFPEEVYVAERALEKYSETQALLQKSAKTYIITDEIAAKISGADMTQGVFAVFKKLDNLKTPVKISSDDPGKGETGDKKIEKAGKDRFIILSSLQDPGNIGAIMRSCEAFGINGLIISADCPDIYSPKVLRASMGGIFRLPVRISPDIRGDIAILRDNGAMVFAASLDNGSVSVSGAEFTEALACCDVAAVIGNEGSGLTWETVSACTGSVRIPMRGPADSLNAAVAAGILIWEMTKNSG